MNTLTHADPLAQSQYCDWSDALPTIEPPQIGVTFLSYGEPAQGVIVGVKWGLSEDEGSVEIETWRSLGDGRHYWFTQWYPAKLLTLDLSVRRPDERLNADDRERARGCASDNRYNYPRHAAVGKISEELR